MIIRTEISSFDEFKPWSGGKDTLDDLSRSQKERLFAYAEEVFPDGCTDTELNDWLWFDRDSIYEYLNIDKNGNDIGSVEWARSILMDYAKEKETTNQFGNIYNIVTSFLDEKYDDGACNDDDDLKHEFDCYVHERWKQLVKQQLMAWHSDIGAEVVSEWLDEHYDNEDEMPDCDDVEERFSDYVDMLNDLNNED